ncbi:MAG: hypothetical protein HYW34_03110 [Candidatus Brennerbacteria bacterium]|nr:hypothetical protein [Candidatus Brennerbacteria bacterium]
MQTSLLVFFDEGMVNFLKQDIEDVWGFLKAVYGTAAIVVGLDKFTFLLADWTGYVSPLVLSVVPLPASAIVNIVGIVEIAAGIIIFSQWTKIGSYIVSAWITVVALNLVMNGAYDIAVRDLIIAAGAFVLAKFTIIKEKAVQEEVHHSMHHSELMKMKPSLKSVV